MKKQRKALNKAYHSLKYIIEFLTRKLFDLNKIL